MYASKVCQFSKDNKSESEESIEIDKSLVECLYYYLALAKMLKYIYSLKLRIRKLQYNAMNQCAFRGLMLDLFVVTNKYALLTGFTPDDLGFNGKVVFR